MIPRAPDGHTKILACRDPRHSGRTCATCDGTGLLEYDTQTGDLRPCYRKQEPGAYVFKPDALPDIEKGGERIY